MSRFTRGLGTVPTGNKKTPRLRPGTTLFPNWASVSKGLQTKSQWEKEGKRLKHNAIETGQIEGKYGLCKLYNKDSVE